MRGVKIIYNGNEFHTANDYDLVQEKKKIDKPAVQSYMQEIPGRNGLLNLTKALTGRVTYNNRNIELQYCAVGKRSHLMNIDDIFTALHGKTLQIIDDDTPDYYYEGECTIETEYFPGYLTIKIVLNAYPFMKAVNETRIVKKFNTVSGIDLHIINNGEPVIPSISTHVSGSTITCRGNVVNPYSFTYADIYKLELLHGVNVYTLQGDNPELVITFREERL